MNALVFENKKICKRGTVQNKISIETTAIYG